MKENARRRLPAMLALLLATAVVLLFAARGGKTYDTADFQQKVALLREEALADWVRGELGDCPAGDAGQVVFLSVSDGSARANVWHASGETLDEAWDNAVSAADAALQRTGREPRWVKADLVYLSGSFTGQELKEALEYSEAGFFYYGAAMDGQFETACLEAELNTASVYQYENGGIDRDALNRYLKQNGQEALPALPDTYRLFRTAGWLCDENSSVMRLSASGQDYGRRLTENVDAALAQSVVKSAAAWLVRQQQRDGSIPTQPRSRSASPTVHARALSAMISAYRLSLDNTLESAIDSAAAWLAKQIQYDGDRAYLRANSSFLIEGGAEAASALAMYMDVFHNDDYLKECRALAEGVRFMLESSAYTLDKDFSPMEREYSPAYDGAAIEALCRVYGLTGDEAYLEAAQAAADRAISEENNSGNAQLTVAVDLLSQYVPGNASYYVFVFESAQKQLETYYELDITAPDGLPLLLSSYQAYDRMKGYGGSAEGFYLEPLIRTILSRAQRQLDGYLFPEYAMYREAPDQALGAFMIREEGMRIDTDVVCRNIQGYVLYADNYEKLVADGLLESGE